MGFRGVPTLGPAERGVVVGTSRSSWHSPTTWGSSSRRRRIRGVLLEEEAEPTGPSVGATASWDPASQMVPANVPDSPLGTVSAVLSATSAEQSAGDSTLPSVRRCFRTTWVTRLAGCGTRGNMKAGLSSWGRSRLSNRQDRGPGCVRSPVADDDRREVPCTSKAGRAAPGPANFEGGSVPRLPARPELRGNRARVGRGVSSFAANSRVEAEVRRT